MSYQLTQGWHTDLYCRKHWGGDCDVLMLALCHIARQKRWNVSKITGIYSLLEFRFKSAKAQNKKVKSRKHLDLLFVGSSAIHVTELSVITGQNLYLQLNIRCSIFINSGGSKMALLNVLYHLSCSSFNKGHREAPDSLGQTITKSLERDRQKQVT